MDLWSGSAGGDDRTANSSSSSSSSSSSTSSSPRPDGRRAEAEEHNRRALFASILAPRNDRLAAVLDRWVCSTRLPTPRASLATLAQRAVSLLGSRHPIPSHPVLPHHITPQEHLPPLHFYMPATCHHGSLTPLSQRDRVQEPLLRHVLPALDEARMLLEDEAAAETRRIEAGPGWRRPSAAGADAAREEEEEEAAAARARAEHRSRRLALIADARADASAMAASVARMLAAIEAAAAPLQRVCAAQDLLRAPGRGWAVRASELRRALDGDGDADGDGAGTSARVPVERQVGGRVTGGAGADFRGRDAGGAAGGDNTGNERRLALRRWILAKVMTWIEQRSQERDDNEVVWVSWPLMDDLLPPLEYCAALIWRGIHT
ncbi:hypothetical protein GGR56DRAFT_661871 [Xylariaceae sp. FL0804]|nr:hypothetical protein GGR56DRAFT_661871 [Xylariaceae sp. FL0804]